MSVTHELTKNWARGNDVLSRQVNIVGEDEQNVSIAINTGETDKEIDFSFVKARLKSIYIVSDQDLKLETNDGTTPQETINLLADKPYQWDDQGYLANPFGGDVTALYATNSSGATANLEIRSTRDATP